MSQKAGNKPTSAGQSARALTGVAGRVAIWIVIGLVGVRGVGAVLAPSQAPRIIPTGEKGRVDLEEAALAVRFARAYLGGDSRRSPVRRYAEGRGAGEPSRGGLPVAQAEVAASEDLGDGREVLTVACQLRDARTLYLAVPVSRSRAGEVAVTGAPWMVAAPSEAGVASERPRPLAGSGAEAIRRLAEKFMPAYLGARSAHDLAYLLAPGAAVKPLSGSLEPLGLLGVAQHGGGEGPQRAVIVSGRYRDAPSGAIYRFAYRLDVVRQGRWYVRAVEGALS